MPTYEYECQKCKHDFEAFQSITAKALTQCPKCKGEVHRLISKGGGIIFKGSGFYHTDYKNKKKKDSCPGEKKNPGCDSCPAKKKD
ncbi:MAG: zinc ribbon domain-containing protein [Candidatus Omnitrophica bacterium]|nr:zinc ribbon domain-containing protein [Candidatus Omnitrophota bacterium]